jgi:rod shape-determining protein MreC
VPYGPSAPRTGDIAETLRLLGCLALAVALMVLDHRGGWLRTLRLQAETVVQPLWQVAGLPARLGADMREEAVTRDRLQDENTRLRNALLISGARISRLQAEAAENARLRELLGASRQMGLDVQLAPILDIALDPSRQRLLLNIGSAQGVRIGQAAIDAGGLVGQVIEVRPNTATVLLLTDPDHAVPVALARNGIRLVAYGRGDRLELANVPMSSDIRVGDLLVTSGLGGRFPPGFPVGRVAELKPDDSRSFLIGRLTPAAQLDRGRDVLLLRNSNRPIAPPVLPVPPPAADIGGGAGTDSAGNAPNAAPNAATQAAAQPPPAAGASGAAAGSIPGANATTAQAVQPATERPTTPPAPRTPQPSPPPAAAASGDAAAPTTPPAAVPAQERRP